MNYSIDNSTVDSNTITNNSLMDVTNLDEIEEHYNNIFYKISDIEPIIFMFNGGLYEKKDNCNLFIKFMTNVVDYYLKPDVSITVILNLKDVDKKIINIPFLYKFLTKFKKKYENQVTLRKFYILYCPHVFKQIYLFIRPLLDAETVEKVKVIKKEKTSDRIEDYYYD